MPWYPRRTVSDEQIVQCYAELGATNKVAKRLSVGQTTVIRVLERHGISRSGLAKFRNSITRFKGQEVEIREFYETGATYEMLCRKFGNASAYAWRHAIKRAGGTIRTAGNARMKLSELERIKELSALGWSQVKISLEIGRSHRFVSRIMRKHDIQNNQTKAGLGRHTTGKYQISGLEYSLIALRRDDPHIAMARQNGYVLEHRYIMARKLGRDLLPTETVHHIDGNTLNNSPKNLQLRQGKHGKHVNMVCLDCGSHNIGHAQI